jgi:hypothetical protein
MTGDALRDIDGLTSCRGILVDDLLIVGPNLVDQALFARRGGLGRCGPSTALLAGRQSLCEIFDHLVELFV